MHVLFILLLLHLLPSLLPFLHLILKCLVFKRPFFKSIPLNCVKTTMIKWLCVQHKQNGKIPKAKIKNTHKIGVCVRVHQWEYTLEPYWLDESFKVYRHFYQFQESSNKSDRKIEMHSSKIMHKTVFQCRRIHI